MTTQLSDKQPLHQSTRSLLLGIWGNIGRRRRIQLALLLLVMIVSGIAELVSLGAVLPFLAVLSDPEQLWQHPLVQNLGMKVGINKSNDLILPATLAFAGAAVLSGLVRLTNVWLNGRVAAAIGSDLSCESYRRTLYQPYEVHVQRNSATIITSTTTNISRTVQACTSFLLMLTAAIVAFGLLMGLLIINWRVALTAIALFGCIYGFLASTVRKELRFNSLLIKNAAEKQIKSLQEGLGAIRDVLLDGNQPAYVETYRQTDRPQRQLQAKNQFLGTFPRYAVEALALVAISFLGGMLVLNKGTSGDVIPLLGAMSLGAQRLLPAIQQMYVGWSSLKGFNADLVAVLAMLNQPVTPQPSAVSKLSLRKSILFDDLYFKYGADQPNVLKGLNLEINRGERVGFIGSTGSGKSTTIDILMGLLMPTSGRLLVDGKNLHDSKNFHLIRSWQSAIAHVPQNIYLADCSITENIAFGVPSSQINIERVKKAAEQAQIACFIEDLSSGYETYVGERGMRLSGGQKQRIGLARALYKQANVLILDEATSALDSETEKSVMSAVEGLGSDLTIIMIAHRLSTLEYCDKVFEIKRGMAFLKKSFNSI